MNNSHIFNRTYFNNKSNNNPIICKDESIISLNDPTNLIKLAEDTELYCNAELLCNLNGCEIKIESKINQDNKLYVKDILFYINGFAVRHEGLQEIILNEDTKLKIKDVPILIKDVTNNYVKIQPFLTNELIINYKNIIINPINYNINLENELHQGACERIPIEIINTQINKLDNIFSSYNKKIELNKSFKKNHNFIDSFDDRSFIKKKQNLNKNKIIDSSDSISIIKKNLLDSSEDKSLILTESTINTSDIVLISDEI